MQDGPGTGNTIESVLIPVEHGKDQRPRMTLCVSSQVLRARS